ncbi:MAG TPA: hypothetical protein VKZ86_03010 [Cyclobacteriaceae bacterium]|nr:hypothetical protein [Cyclobacteriaceae bacterium]
MKRGGRIFLWVLFGLLMLALLTFLTQQLWNWLVPDLFGGPVVTFWQALGLLVLSKILLGGFGKGGHRGSHSWKMKFREKFGHLSPEEREALKQRIRQKWCPSHDDIEPEDRKADDSAG